MGKKKGKKQKGTTVSLKEFLGDKAKYAVKNAMLPDAPRFVRVAGRVSANVATRFHFSQTNVVRVIFF